MSATIDSRVVEMQFDNKHFESNVQTSMNTIDKLKQKLDLTGASKGLENIDAATKRVDMSTLGNAVETVRTKFSALQIMGVTALANITNSAVNAGKRIVSALTIDPIKTGFSEYETKINAIQTIMSNTASKGTTMDDVTKVIGELNTYADKTIYNFAEMTRNIGTFTAAGIGLEESAAAIQGIANLAAASGSNSQQASTAMYQLSQALSTGTVRLMDWNSVVNAGMGGEKFQEALKATAREHGVAVDDIIEKNGSFRDSLQDGWLSADILNTTLQKFTVEGAKDYAKSMVEAGKWTQKEADALVKEAQAMEDAATKVKTFTQLWDTLKESAQSGWSQTWEIVVGDFEEAKETLTKFSEVIGGMIGASADARNELLQGWKDAGGRADLIDSLYNVFEGLMSIVKPIKEAFREIFPATTVTQLVNFTKNLKELTAKFKLSETTSNNLKRTFKGLFAVLDIIKQAFVAVAKGVGSLMGGVGKLGGGILGVTASFGDWLVKLRDSIKQGDVFNKIVQGIVVVIKKIASAIGNLASWFKTNLIDPMLNIGDAADNMKDRATGAFESMSSTFENCGIVKFMQTVWKGITTLANGIARAFTALTGGLFNMIGNADFNGILDFVNSLIAGGVGVGLIKFLKSLTKPLDGLQGLLDGVTGILDGVRGCFEAYQTQLKAGALMKIAGAIAILTASILVLSFIDSAKLAEALGAITVLFTELMVSLSIFSKIAGEFTGVTKACTAMIAVSIAVLILSSALKKISSLSVSEMATGLVGLFVMINLLVNAAKKLSTDGKTMIKGAGQMIIMAVAIKILASACTDLAMLSWEELATGLVGVTGLMLVLVAAAKTMERNSKTMIKGAGYMLVMSVSLKILASSCEDLAMLSWEELARGLAGLTGLMLILVAAAKTMERSSKTILKGAGYMLTMSVALTVLAFSCDKLASLSWEELARGLAGLTGLMLILVAAAKVMSTDGTKIVKGAGQMLIMSASLTILAGALKIIASMSWEELAKGLVALTAALVVMAGTLTILSKLSTGSGAGSILVMALALNMLILPLKILGGMSWGSLIKGLVGIAGAFVIMGVAGVVLGPIAPMMLAVAGALALLGVAVLAAGVGLLAFGAGLSALSVGFTALVASLGAVCTGIISLVSALVVGICKGIADGIIAFCQIIIDGIPAIGEALTVLVLTLCKVLADCVPVIADTLLKLVAALLQSLVEYTPVIVDALFAFVIGLIDGLARNLPKLIQAVVNVFMALFSGVLDALGNIDFKTLVEGMAGVGLIAGVMMALAAIAGLIPAAMAGVLGMGLVIAELAIVLGAIGALAQIPGLTWLVEEGAELMQAIGNAIGGLIGGLIGGFAEGVTGSLPQIATDLSNFMTNVQPFIEGAKQIDSSVFEGVKTLVGVILALTGANILESLTSWLTGGSSLTKFGEELASFGPHMRTYADAIAGIDATAVEASANAAKALAEMTSYIPNEGGVVSWFTGENSISKFGTEIVALGVGLKSFSDSVVGIVPENVVAAANAGKALTEMTASIPNEGGMVAWFTGENSVSKFATDIVNLGHGLKGFSDSVAGIVPENLIAAAGAAQTLAEMTASIPNEGGMVAWFTGENSISKFGTDLINLGMGLKGFSDAITGVVPENLVAAAGAAQALAEMTNSIPNEGGIVAWFTGDNSLSKFSDQLPQLGVGLKGFSDSIAGIVPENVTAAANAAKSLAEMASIIPNQGGIVAWFTGDNSVSKFGSGLVSLGRGLKGFSDAVAGIVPENLVSAANAAKGLAEMAAILPNQGGVVAWFAGESSISKFGTDLIALGIGLKGFAVATAGIVPENVTAAANAAKALAEMANVVPNQGGIVAWFTGENSVAKFGEDLPKLGEGLKGFSDSVAGISPENVTAAANAAKTLAEMTDIVPKKTDKLEDFGENLNKFGGKLSSYFSKVRNITSGDITASKNAISAVEQASTIDSGKVKTAAKAIDSLIESIKGMAKVTKSSATNFRNALQELGKVSTEALLKEFKNIEDDMRKAGQAAIDAFIKGVKARQTKAKNACKALASDCASAITKNTSGWKSAGRECVAGFVKGIDANTFKAEAKAKAMAKAALEAAEKALGINSPSKEFYKDGSYAGQGFVNALADYASTSYDAGSEMAMSAKHGLYDAIRRIGDVINGDLDTQPTIRPVLDLSDVRSGAGAISDMIGAGSSIGVLANVGSISTMMGRRNQNGSNDDVVSALRDLKNSLGKAGDTYNIGGITYDDESSIAEAVKTIVRAAIVERRI